MLRSSLGAVFLAIALSGCLAACGSTATAAVTTPTVTVSVEHCGRGWTAPHPGQQTFTLDNDDIVAGEVFLVRSATDAVVGYVDNVAPGAEALLSVDLGSGSYQFRCVMSDRDVVRGATVVVPGHARGDSVAVAAVTQNDLIPITKAYQSWVEAALPALRSDASALSSDLNSGALAQAKVDWLRAHLDYERLGGAYGAFGDLATRIDGTTTGLVGGVSDTRFAGFHRIEYGLWHGQSAAQLAPYGSLLVAAIGELDTNLNETRIAPLDVAIRAHEIAENALQFDLTGESDFGSGTELASVDAELTGTAELLTLLRPVLASRYPDLGTTERRLAQAQSDVRDADVAGAWTPLTSLGTVERERVDSDVSELTDLLAPVAAICEPRSTR
jgi:iron uptake system component EfeO